MTAKTFEKTDDLRAHMGESMELAIKKVIPKLDKYSRAFIARSPFLCIATSNAKGDTDVSPRGDPPGFVQILDDATLYIPDRPGNNRLDTMGNIMENPNVGLIFLVPGFDDTLRVNGKARIVDDGALATNAEIRGKRPKVGIEVSVEQAFLHCAKALKRSKLWEPKSRQDRKEFPSLARMILEQTAAPESPPTVQEVKEGDDYVEDNYETGLY